MCLRRSRPTFGRTRQVISAPAPSRYNTAGEERNRDAKTTQCCGPHIICLDSLWSAVLNSSGIVIFPRTTWPQKSKAWMLKEQHLNIYRYGTREDVGFFCWRQSPCHQQKSGCGFDAHVVPFSVKVLAVSSFSLENSNSSNTCMWGQWVFVCARCLHPGTAVKGPRWEWV